MAEERKGRVAGLTDECLEGWALYADRHGATVVALVETFGTRLAELDQPLGEIPDPLRTWTEAARDLARTRQRRRGRRKADPA